MSVDQRLRTGLQRPGPESDPDTLAALHRVERRVDRRARTIRAGIGALVAAAVVLVVGATVALQRDDPADRDRLAVDGPTTSARQLEGTYVVDVGDSPEGREEGMVGRWVVTLAPDGALELRPPPDYTGVTLGSAYRVVGERLRTDALVEPACQADNGFVGTYASALVDDRLAFTLVEDQCVSRRILFTGQQWERLP